MVAKLAEIASAVAALRLTAAVEFSTMLVPPIAATNLGGEVGRWKVQDEGDLDDQEDEMVEQVWVYIIHSRKYFWPG